MSWLLDAYLQARSPSLHLPWAPGPFLRGAGCPRQCSEAVVHNLMNLHTHRGSLLAGGICFIPCLAPCSMPGELSHFGVTNLCDTDNRVCYAFVMMFCKGRVSKLAVVFTALQLCINFKS